MNNISLVISGNLTGFSRFYASPTANDILNEAKFDFDYRNYLTFLNSGEKVYALSFAPTVLAVSLVTRILDSFRRPGILVVTLLIPRRSKVVSTINSQNPNAFYQLLNEINDKFYEKNFVNGMLNQNAAVLMQDYYTDILANYTLAVDGMQRNINSTIEITSPNKRVGYVQTTENNVPLYLASTCRRSYEGCHHVFFAQNPIQNLIAEEPIEVVYYRVHITNTGQSLPSVTLNDKIPNVRPSEGEIDIEKNFTYQQVINGDAGRNIYAELREETIEITYRFGLEEKTIKFIFNEGGKNIPFTSIMPVLEFNDAIINIPSETYTFQGKEIYGSKKIKSRGTDYRVKRESESLDLRRLQDTCIIQVEHCFSLRLFFNQPESKSKRIIFNSSNHGQFPFTDVTDYLEIILPGYQEEYSYTIESLYYEKETGYLTPAGTQIQLPQLKPVSSNPPTTQRGNLSVSSSTMQPIGKQTTSNVRGGSRGVRSKEVSAHSVGKQTGGVLQLKGVESQERLSKSNNKKNDRWPINKYKIIIPITVAVICLCLISIPTTYLSDWGGFSNDNNGNGRADDANNEQLARIYFIDDSEDVVKLENFENHGLEFSDFNNLVDVKLTSGNDAIELSDTETNDTIWYRFKIQIPINNNPIEYHFQLNIKCYNKIIGEAIFNSTSFNDNGIFDKEVKLSVKTSELLYYIKAFKYNERYKQSDNGINCFSENEKKEIKKIIDLANKNSDDEFIKLISELIDPINKAFEDQKKEAQENSKKTGKKGNPENQNTTENNNSLPEEIKQRVINGMAVAESTCKNLTDENKKKIIEDYNIWVKNEYERMKKTDWKGQKQQIDSMLKNIEYYFQIEAIIKNKAYKKSK